MEVSLSELLRCNYFRDANIIAGRRGAGNVVHSVTVMDSPDAYDYMNGGELVLSSGYFFLNQPNLQEQVLMNLISKRVAALGIITNYTQGVLPDTMREIADKTGFPIVSLTDQHTYVDTYEYVHLNLLSHTTGEVRRSDSVIQEINDAGTERGLQGILDVLHKWTGLDLMLLYDTFCYTNKENSLLEILPTELEYWPCRVQKHISHKKVAVPGRRQKLEAIWTALTLCNEQAEGRLIMIAQGRETTGDDRHLLEVAARACSAEVDRQKKLCAVQRQYRGEFIRRFFSGDMICEDARLLARESGMIIPKIGQAIVLDSDVFDPKNEKNREARQLFENSAVHIFGSSTICGFITSQKGAIYVDPERDSSEGKLRLLQLEMTDMFPESLIKIGVARPGKPENIAASFREACMASDLGCALGCQGEIFKFSDLGFYRLLNFSETESEYSRYCLDYLEPILQRDESDYREMALFETLRMYISCRFNYRAAGRKMFLHPNTVRYRIDLIEKLCGCDFNNSFDRLNMEVALRLYILAQKTQWKSDWPPTLDCLLG